MRRAGTSIGCAVAVLAVGASLAVGPATAQTTSFTPGSSGGADPYFPLQGNGGYDVQH